MTKKVRHVKWDEGAIVLHVFEWADKGITEAAVAAVMANAAIRKAMKPK